MPKFQAIGKMVCLRQITKEDEVTKGGIHLPHRVRVNKHDICVVQSVGTEVKDVIVGDKVLIPYYDGEPIKVDTAHFGLTLIRTAKIAAMPKPWFWGQPDSSGGWGEDRVDDDIYFWNKWKESGNSIYVAPDCNIGHLELMVSQFKTTGAAIEPEHIYVKDWYTQRGGKAKSW